MSTSRNKVLAPLAAVAGVAAVAVTVALISSNGASHPSASGTTHPSVLHLAGGAEAPAASAGSGDYRLSGTLPTATPDDAPVWTLTGSADQATVSKLAAALGQGEPVRSGSTWRAGTLTVTGGTWTFSPCAPESSVPNDTSSASSSCAVSAPGVSSGGSAVTPTTPSDVPASTVREAAKKVFAALGLDLDKAQVDSSPYGGSVALNPTVDGLSTSGIATRLDIDRQGAVTDGNGLLSTPARGASYPLLSARQAYDQLPALAHPDICQVDPSRKHACLPPKPVVLTGAHLGLSLQQLAEGGSVLVPSWLFDVQGSTDPVVGIALARQFVAHDQARLGGNTTDPATAAPGIEPAQPINPVVPAK